MDIKDFIGSTVKELDTDNFEKLKGKLVGEYLAFSFVEESRISQEVLCEKICDYFEKIEIKTGNKFAKILSEYVNDLDEVIKRYIPKEPSAKKGEPAPKIPRSIMYYKHAVGIKESRNLTIKQITDYSRVMMNIYMEAIKSGMKEVYDYEFSTEYLDLDKMITSLKAEKGGIALPIGKKTLFDLEELYCSDTATFIIFMIMFYHIKNNEVKGEY